jgi:hypothetical protein
MPGKPAPEDPRHPRRRGWWLTILIALVAWISWMLRRRGHPRPLPGVDVYSSPHERREWTRQLRRESGEAPKISFHRVGFLTGLSGDFPLSGKKAAAAVKWVRDHRKMLGIPEGVELDVSEEADRYPGIPGLQRPGGEVEASNTKQPLSRPEANVVTYRIHPRYREYPYSESIHLVVTDGALRGLYNACFPADRLPTLVTTLDEEAAWQTAESFLDSSLVRVSAVQLCIDGLWLTQRVPSTPELHWRLEGVDAAGMLRYAVIRSADARIVFATPERTSFYEVHQTHVDDQSYVLWDNLTLPNGCAPAGQGSCSGPAWEESKVSRKIIPEVIDLWYRLSTPGGSAPWVWPFSGSHKSPLDNRSNGFKVVVGHNGSFCNEPCRFANVYYLPPGTTSPAHFGHEYGHAFLNELKMMHPGGHIGVLPPAASFTEALCDLAGIISEKVLTSEYFAVNRPVGWSRSSEFEIGQWQWRKDTNGNWVVLGPPRVAWDARDGQNYPRDSFGNLYTHDPLDRIEPVRERIGRALYCAWEWIVGFYGDRPQVVRDSNYHAWWTDIFRSFTLLPDLPDMHDFYAATVSRTSAGAYVLKEAVISYRLCLELENHGFDR